MLGITALAGNARMIRFLARLGADVNLPSPCGKTALAIAVTSGFWQICADLIAYGAQPALPVDGGYPALYYIVSAALAPQHVDVQALDLLRRLHAQGVPFDILVRSPDARQRNAKSVVTLNDLLRQAGRLEFINGRAAPAEPVNAQPIGRVPVNTADNSAGLSATSLNRYPMDEGGGGPTQ
ncbi:ankyrin repeat domain-containing protein [Noviherbaspirillum pedocola]|uniref:Ankyrin repeat domain-containing protein n=1 Tax=Noviherbaspirillum pedocola TaxID=2801341 RepID=A0A934T159_9BURK|nr:hypothetical protein [Noviherbaspirillum pedocola]MBK4738846.1 hypothetical protein [Noviherbaspirillum pedocola]